MAPIENCEYTHYNPYTITGRPSNTFAGTNYAAIPNDKRVRYVTRYVNGFLIDIDLSSFHLHLLYSILGLSIPEDIYKSLSVLYPDDVDAKEYTFRQIYGGIDQSLLNKTPFAEIDSLADLLFGLYMSGTLKTLMYDRSFVLPTGLNKWKVFNYCLQSLETEHNMEIIDKCVNNALPLILYTYDSFLFDVDAPELSRFIDKVKEIFSGMDYKVKVGRNYGEMKSIIL